MKPLIIALLTLIFITGCSPEQATVPTVAKTDLGGHGSEQIFLTHKAAMSLTTTFNLD